MVDEAGGGLRNARCIEAISREAIHCECRCGDIGMTDTCESEDDHTQTPPRTLADLKVGDEVVTRKISQWYDYLELATRERAAIQNFRHPLLTLADARKIPEREWYGGPNCGRKTVKGLMTVLHASRHDGVDDKVAAELRQREALERVERWLDHYKEWNRKQDLIVGYIGSDGKFELLVSDLIEVVKMARKI